MHAPHPALQSLSHTYLRSLLRMAQQHDRLPYMRACMASVDAGPDYAASGDHTFAVRKKVNVKGGKPYGAVFTLRNSRGEIMLQVQ